MKVLYENLPRAFALAEEILTKSDYTDKKRLYELVAEARSCKQANMMSAGHTLAAGRALAYFSKPAMVLEHINGIPFYRLLESLEKDFDVRKEELSANLDKVIRCIFRPENLLVDYTAEKEGLAGIERLIEEFKRKLYTEIGRAHV